MIFDIKDNCPPYTNIECFCGQVYTELFIDIENKQTTSIFNFETDVTSFKKLIQRRIDLSGRSSLTKKALDITFNKLVEIYEETKDFSLEQIISYKIEENLLVTLEDILELNNISLEQLKIEEVKYVYLSSFPCFCGSGSTYVVLFGYEDGTIVESSSPDTKPEDQISIIKEGYRFVPLLLPEEAFHLAVGASKNPVIKQLRGY